ncbi:MAG: SPOR domain-containing protein [Bacteroidales bacterium]
MKYYFLCIVWCMSLIANAQSNNDDSPEIFSHLSASETEENGSIEIHQDTQISKLINRHVTNNIARENTIEGWRIQIYNSTGKETRADVLKVRSKFLSKYPDVKTYVIYQPPIFKIRIGDFRTRESAYYLYKKVIKDYPVSYMIRDDISLPELQPEGISN